MTRKASTGGRSNPCANCWHGDRTRLVSWTCCCRSHRLSSSLPMVSSSAFLSALEVLSFSWHAFSPERKILQLWKNKVNFGSVIDIPFNDWKTVWPKLKSDFEVHHIANFGQKISSCVKSNPLIVSKWNALAYLMTEKSSFGWKLDLANVTTHPFVFDSSDGRFTETKNGKIVHIHQNGCGLECRSVKC